MKVSVVRVSVLYTASALSTGDGRNGHVRSSDGLLDLDLAAPPRWVARAAPPTPSSSSPRATPRASTPRSRAWARQKKVTFSESAVAAEVVSARATKAAASGSTVALHVELGGIDQAAADELVAAAHQVCPYSNATRGNVDVAIDTTVA